MPNQRRRHEAEIQAIFDTHRRREEGAWHDTIIAGQRRQTALAGILGSRSPHQKQTSGIHKEFAKEIASGTANVASFLLHYACCEASARLLLAASHGKPPQKAESEEILLRPLKSAMKKHQIDIDDDLVDRVFAGTFHSFAQASARRLRDKIIHLFHPHAIDQIRSRGGQLFSDMDRIIRELGEKADSYNGF